MAPIRGAGGTRTPNHGPSDSIKPRGAFESGPGMEQNDGRVPAEKMARHAPSFDQRDYDIDGPQGKGKNSKEQSYSNMQVPGGPNSRAQVQPGLHNESQVIPALKNKGGKGTGLPDDEFGDDAGNDGGAFSLQNAEEIKLADSSKAEPLIPYLSELLVKGIFSKNWNIRDHAVKVMSQEITKGSKSEMYIGPN